LHKLKLAIFGGGYTLVHSAAYMYIVRPIPSVRLSGTSGALRKR